ncbi:hypothetical protein MUCCIDRAFT_162834 [Mucor lusitanicus CBS 277.49]|uniref:Der GTPase-activating protein YihI n=1 Tax=Mucor lusitanicus CBS 277.49 TaxID=747725 RepID=A0A162TB43_MUCCL|nr:hypothetical protein MUCCIDRAFT_162834 [Mucor lusitanicus CBS 277.49]
MGKAKRESSVKKTPYTRNNPTQSKDKKAIVKNKKPLTKSEKLKNADLTEDLDNLMDDLTQHLAPKKKKAIKIKNDSMDDTSKLEEEQRRYEKTQTDMDDALGLLTKL